MDDVFSGLRIGDTVGLLWDVELKAVVVFVNRKFVLEAEGFKQKVLDNLPKPGQTTRWYPFVHMLGSCKAVSIVKNALPPVIGDGDNMSMRSGRSG